jgi:hypothetical protein
LPFIPTIAWGLLLDRFHAPGWLLGQMTHQHCGGAYGWGTDVLYPGADPDEAIDAAMTQSTSAGEPNDR